MNFPEFFKAKLSAAKVLWQMGELSLNEIQHVGIAVSKANGCSYCTAAFCTILNYGLKTDEGPVKQFVVEGAKAVPQTDYDYRDMWRQLAFENKTLLRSR